MQSRKAGGRCRFFRKRPHLQLSRSGLGLLFEEATAEMKKNQIPIPPSRPWIIAHRGARDASPENTRSAFVTALSYPVDGIELDVQLSADGHLVVYHDWTLRRLARPGRYLFKAPLSELAALDWGGWFHPAFAGEPLPLLQPILAELGPRTRWLIEIKSHPAEKANGRALHLTHAVLDLLDSLGDRIPDEAAYVLSFDADLLRLAAERRPERRYVLNLSEKEADSLKDGHAATDHLWGVDAPVSKVSAQLAEWARKRNLRIFAYTCNGPRQVVKALRLGLDGVITDRPGWLTRLWARAPQPF